VVTSGPRGAPTPAADGAQAVFLDIDGTFADHGTVPAGHVAAVRQARAAGHRVLLATGRPMVMLVPAILAAGFDGLVASAGAYVEVGGRLLRDERFPAGLAARTVEVLNEHDVAYILEAPEVLLGPPGVGERLVRLVTARTGSDAVVQREAPRDIIAALRTSPDLRDASFAKVTYFESPVAGDVLADRIGAGVAALPSSLPDLGPGAGELYLRDVHKAVGLRLAAEALGIAQRDVVAIGDGFNDVEMLAWAGTGVAIEGADPRVLAAADLVVPGPEHEGLVEAFRALGLT
jgi:Cof subfamily protein (haloacid dehalogenase superfamily)